MVALKVLGQTQKRLLLGLKSKAISHKVNQHWKLLTKKRLIIATRLNQRIIAVLTRFFSRLLIREKKGGEE